MKIIISGHFGAGKSTMRKKLQERFNMAYASAGGIQRELVKAENERREAQRLKPLNYDDHAAIYEAMPDLHSMVDTGMTEYGKRNNNFVADYRLGALFIPDSYKILLVVSPDVGAERIFNNVKDNPERQGLEYYVSVEDAKQKNIQRQTHLQEDLKRVYNFDYLDKSHYDIVIDTTHMTIDQVYAQILREAIFRTNGLMVYAAAPIDTLERALQMAVGLDASSETSG